MEELKNEEVLETTVKEESYLPSVEPSYEAANYEEESSGGIGVKAVIAGVALVTGAILGGRYLWKRHKAKKGETTDDVDEEIFESDDVAAEDDFKVVTEEESKEEPKKQDEEKSEKK